MKRGIARHFQRKKNPHTRLGVGTTFFIPAKLNFQWTKHHRSRWVFPKKSQAGLLAPLDLSGGLPIPIKWNSGTQGRKGTLSIHPGKSESVTAAGPLPTHTGFPVIPCGHLRFITSSKTLNRYNDCFGLVNEKFSVTHQSHASSKSPLLRRSGGSPAFSYPPGR